MGTRSVLLGAHCWFIHPWFVLAAWVRLYGWPKHPAYYVAFFVHDLGYLGKERMDDAEGEMHPLLGARIMAFVFDRGPRKPFRGAISSYVVNMDGHGNPIADRSQWWSVGRWGALVLLHSRFMCKRYGMRYSRLCVADKLALSLTPWWLYVPLVRLTGEIHEYMAMADARRDAGEKTLHRERMAGATPMQWYRRVQEHNRAWAWEHLDGREDTWTPATAARLPVDGTGVWQ